MSSRDRREYLDFELQIGEGRGRSYPVTVIRSPAGGTGATTMRFPFSQLELENRRKDLEIALLNSDVVRGAQRRVASTNEQPIQQFGRPLFQALFTGEVRSCYEISLAEALKQGKGLRLKLRIGAPELAELPWEYLFDDVRQNEYLSLSRATPLVRYLEVSGPVEPLAVVPPLRILGLVASPSDLDRLDVEREMQRVDEAVAGLRARGLVELTWLPRPTFRDLQREMRSSGWNVFHFTGHGGFNEQAQEGYIALADDAGKSHHLSATQVSRLLGDQPNLRLVLLNACEGARGDKNDIFSSTAASLVRHGIPAVVAMQFPISDSAAIEFARTFYEVLMEGLPVDRAVSEARIAISLATPNTVEWGTPVLIMHSPNGILFDLPPRGPLASSSSDLTTTEGPEQERLSAPPPQATSNPIRSAPSPADVHQEPGTTRPIVPPVTERRPGSPESAAPPAKPVGTIQDLVHVVSRPIYALTAGFIVIALVVGLLLARGAGSPPPLATPTAASPVVPAATATSGAALAAAALDSPSLLMATAIPSALPSPTGIPSPVPLPTAAAPTLPTLGPVVRPASTATSGAALPATASPTFTPCVVQPVGGFGLLYNANPALQSGLGCATAPEKSTTFVLETFQTGFMLWRDDLNGKRIAVFVCPPNTTIGCKGTDYPDVFQPGRPLPTPTAIPPGLFAPVNGFGLLWQTRSMVQTIGWATATEKSVKGSAETFLLGEMFWTPDYVIYVVYTNGVGQIYADKSPH